MRRHLGSSPPLHHFQVCYSVILRSASCMDVGGASSLGTTSSTMASPWGLGVRAGQTDAGALPPPAPGTVRPWATTYGEGNVTCTSSSRIGSQGSPTSSGIDPKAASPSVAYCPPVNVVHSSSASAGYRHTGVDIHSGRAPARHGQAPLPQRRPLCAERWVGTACFLLVC